MVHRTGKSYYPQNVLKSWKECKYVVKRKKMPKYITIDMGISCDYSDAENANEESDFE